MSNVFYVCFSPAHLTCGAAHKDLKTANGCCASQARKGIDRKPFPVSASRKVDAKLSAASAWGFSQATYDSKLSYLTSKGASPRSLPPVNESPDNTPETMPLCEFQGRKENPRYTEENMKAEAEKAKAKSETFTPATIKADTKAPSATGADAEALALAEALIALKGSQGALDTEAVKALIAEALAANTDPAKAVLTVQALPANGEGPPRNLGLAHKSLPLLMKEMQRGNNALLCGEAGSGKTHGAEQAAKALGRECFLIPQVLDAFTDVSGYMDAQGAFVETPLYKWAKAEAGAVLILDEMDGSDPNALLRANALLAGGAITFPNGEYVKVPEGHTVIGCVNTWGNGPTAEFMGRAPLDGASLDRFPSKLSWAIDGALETAIVTDGLEGDVKTTALQTVNVSQRIRENLKTYGIRLTWGPRNTIGLCKRTTDGDTLAEALEVSSLAQLDESQRKNALTGVSL